MIEDGNEYNTDYSIAALHEDALLHQVGLNDNDGFDKEDMYVEHGDSPQRMVKKDLQNRIQRGKANALSNDGAKTFNTTIDKRKPILKMQLGSGGPAKVMLLKIALDDPKNSIMVEVCWLLDGQRKLHDAYFEELFSVGFLKP